MIYCSNCGKRYSAEADFCPFCGHPTTVKSADNAAPASQPAAAQPVQQLYVAPQPAAAQPLQQPYAVPQTPVQPVYQSAAAQPYVQPQVPEQPSVEEQLNQRLKEEDRKRCLASALRQSGMGLAFGIVSLVFGLLALIFACASEEGATAFFVIFGLLTYFVSGPFSTVGLIRTAVNRGGASKKAIAGLVIGTIALFLNYVILLVMAELY